MTTVTIEAGTLTASRADRIVSGLLLPFGEVGRTNLGRFSIPPGVITVPPDASVVTLNNEHDRATPMGRALTLTATAAGVVAAFRVANTPEGDAYLTDVENGRRRSLSAEVADVVIRAGKAVSGRLFGAAACIAGAFPSATLMASDVGDVLDAADTVPMIDPVTGLPIVDPAASLDDAATQVTQALDTIMASPGSLPPDAAAALADMLRTAAQAVTDALVSVTETAAAVPAPADPNGVPVPTLTASAPADQRRPRASSQIGGVADLFARLAGAHSSASPQLLAALDQVIQADGQAAQQPQWLDELWKSRTYARRYAPLIQHAPLTGLKATGWRFIDGKTPTVGDYAGFPAQPTSTETKTESVDITAARLAGAVAVDRAFQDFTVPGFWEGFYRESTNDYERKIDAKVPALLVASAGAVVADAVPAGVTTAVSYIVDGAMAIIDEERGLPAFAIVGSALYKALLRTRKEDSLEYLSIALGVAEGDVAGFRIVPSSLAAFTGKVLVGTADCATLYELAGVPVRVDTVNVANGSVETGVFGYWSGLVNDAKGLKLVAVA